MSSSAAAKCSSYNPYAIKSIVGKTSMKALAAKAAAQAISEIAKEKEEKPDDKEIFNVDSDSNDCVMVDSDEDALADPSPQSSRSRSLRRKNAAEIECLDDDESVEVTMISAKKPTKKKRLTKAEKVKKAAKDAQGDASRKAREALMASLDSANENSLASRSKTSTPPSQTDSESDRELIFVLWKTEKYKFHLTKTEPMRAIFDQMAVKMGTDASKVLIFCNSDPSKTVSTLDCLDDVGRERIFLTALRKDAAAEKVEEDIPDVYRISFNVQGAGSKVRTKVVSDRRENLGAFMARYCRMMGKNVGSFIFSFDGGSLIPTKMAEFYELEGDEVIDAALV